MNRLDLDRPLTAFIPRKHANLLAERLELRTTGDVLRHYPRRYQERGRLTDLAELVVGERATVWASVVRVNDRRLPPKGGQRGRRPRFLTNVVIADGRRQLTCTFFNQPYWSSRLPPGTTAMFSGKVTEFNRSLQMSSPIVEIVEDEDGRPAALEALRAGAERNGGDADVQTLESFPGGVIPVYPLADGVTQAVLQRVVRTVLDGSGTIVDPVPDGTARPARTRRPRHGTAGRAPAARRCRAGRRAAAAALRRGAGDSAGARPAPRRGAQLPGRAVPADRGRAARRVRPEPARSS